MRELDADIAVPDNKKTMNAKAETIGTGKAADAGLLTLAALIVVADWASGSSALPATDTLAGLGSTLPSVPVKENA